ncbi:hypothetical protein J6590_108761 [Homalodisca vitripennis]|nr:hypothetical protein J6590_108761 [Homalodisca vitripennis]
MVKRENKGTLELLIQEELNLISNCCHVESQRINPSKTNMITFTRKRKFQLTQPVLEGISINQSKEVKYLVLILDQKLTWNSHIENRISKATMALGACKRLFRFKWGLKPKMIYWIYETIIKPMVTYAALVWWPKVEQTTAAKRLQSSKASLLKHHRSDELPPNTSN